MPIGRIFGHEKAQRDQCDERVPIAPIGARASKPKPGRFIARFCGQPPRSNLRALSRPFAVTIPRLRPMPLHCFVVRLSLLKPHE